MRRPPTGLLRVQLQILYHLSPTNNLYRFSLTNANSFAWIADTRYLIQTDSLFLDSGKAIKLYK